MKTWNVCSNAAGLVGATLISLQSMAKTAPDFGGNKAVAIADTCGAIHSLKHSFFSPEHG